MSALLLTTRGTALTLDQLHHTLQDSLDYLERKQTPMTNSALRLRTADGVRAALDALSNEHPITCVDGGREPVWRIAPEQEHEAAFYRNTIIDAFLETAIVEMALGYAARAEGDRLEAFWTQAMRLRDLLKFDFYFADSAGFREHIAEEMAWNDDWESCVAAGGDNGLLIGRQIDDLVGLDLRRRSLATSFLVRRRMKGWMIARRRAAALESPWSIGRAKCSSNCERAEQPGADEVEDRPDLAEAILDRRAGQREAALGAELARRPRRRAQRVLDVLRLVEDRVVEVELLRAGPRRAGAARSS